MMKLKNIIKEVLLLCMIILLISQSAIAQSFLTADYPEYATKVKLRYQQASFKYLSQSETSCGIYNISFIRPFNHRLSGTLNIPIMADYTVSDNRNVRAGNFELGLNIINARWRNKATVVGLGFVIPFGTQNIYNREDADSNFSSLYQRACLTDFARCNWYVPGVWTAMVKFHFHFRKDAFHLAAGAVSGFMLRKTVYEDVSPLTFMFQPVLKLGYDVNKVSFIGEILNAFYINPEGTNSLDIEEKAYFMGTLGISYNMPNVEVGVYYQLNMNSVFQDYVVSVIGLQLMLKMKKQEEYLKTLKK